MEDAGGDRDDTRKVQRDGRRAALSIPGANSGAEGGGAVVVADVAHALHLCCAPRWALLSVIKSRARLRLTCAFIPLAAAAAAEQTTRSHDEDRDHGL